MQGAPGAEDEEQGGSFQAYTEKPSVDSYGDLDIPELVSASTNDNPDELAGGMGSMTGWRAIAAQVRAVVCLIR